jgi:hypothetical protein
MDGWMDGWMEEKGGLMDYLPQKNSASQIIPVHQF